MAMMKKFADNLVLTGTAVGDPQSMKTTPFQGYGGVGKRTAILALSAAPGGAAVLKIQGHDAADEPDTADTGWYDIVSLTSASDLRQEIALSPWMRTNITTLGTGTIDVDLEGVQ